jgi:hypothetical protein
MAGRGDVIVSAGGIYLPIRDLGDLETGNGNETGSGNGSGSGNGNGNESGSVLDEETAVAVEIGEVRGEAATQMGLATGDWWRGWGCRVAITNTIIWVLYLRTMEDLTVLVCAFVLSRSRGYCHLCIDINSHSYSLLLPATNHLLSMLSCPFMTLVAVLIEIKTRMCIRDGQYSSSK